MLVLRFHRQRLRLSITGGGSSESPPKKSAIKWSPGVRSGSRSPPRVDHVLESRAGAPPLREHRGEQLARRGALQRRELALVVAGQQPEAHALAGIGKRGLEAASSDECDVAFLREGGAPGALSARPPSRCAFGTQHWFTQRTRNSGTNGPCRRSQARRERCGNGCEGGWAAHLEVRSVDVDDVERAGQVRLPHARRGSAQSTAGSAKKEHACI